MTLAVGIIITECGNCTDCTLFVLTQPGITRDRVDLQSGACAATLTTNSCEGYEKRGNLQ